MYKNIKSKIILISVLIGLILIGTLGFLYINSLAQIPQVINGQDANLLMQAKKTVVIIIAIYLVLASSIAVYLSKFVICPKNKYIKSDERAELKDKLNEVSSRKNQIETILLHMTDGIIAFNMQGEIILINPAAKKFLSISPEDNTFDDIFGKFKLDINMEKVIYLESWTSTEQRIQVDDQYVKVLFAPFKNEDERPDGVIAVIQDITEHVKLDNMQKELVADVSHELKTPIALIQGYSEGLLENVNSDEESRKFYAEVILDETNKMDKLVKQLLELMKLEYGKREFNNKEFNIVELEKEVIRKTNVMIEEKQAEIKFDDSKEIQVFADDFYIEQVLTNYLTNAIKNVKEMYGEKYIKISNEIRKDENKVCIKVFNTGEKISEENLNRIWNRFYKADESRHREDGGTGIGLAFVKAIMGNYDNKFGVNNLENGVEFYFELDVRQVG